MSLTSNAFDITSALETGKQLITWVFDLVSENVILTACFVVGSLIPLGINMFGHLKHTVK